MRITRRFRFELDCGGSQRVSQGHKSEIFRARANKGSGVIKLRLERTRIFNGFAYLREVFDASSRINFPRGLSSQFVSLASVGGARGSPRGFPGSVEVGLCGWTLASIGVSRSGHFIKHVVLFALANSCSYSLS